MTEPAMDSENRLIGKRTDARPCPFCGSDKIIVTHMSDWTINCHCWTCKSDGPKISAELPDENAVLAWNERQPCHWLH